MNTITQNPCRGNADASVHCGIGVHEWQPAAPLCMRDFEARMQP